MVSWRMLRWSIPVLVATLLLTAWTTAGRWLPSVMQWLDVGQPPRETDVALVLMGDEDVRPFVAAALYNTGFVRRVLVAHHDDTETENNPYWPARHEVVAGVLQARGVPAADIEFLGSGSRNTMHEIEALVDYLRQHPDQQVTIVTSNFHTRRTRWSYRRRLGDLMQRVHFVSAPCDDFSADHWWRSQDGFVLIITEYIKLLIYQFVYGWFGWYVAGLFAIVIGFRIRRSRGRRRLTAPSAASPSPNASY